MKNFVYILSFLIGANILCLQNIRTNPRPAEQKLTSKNDVHYCGIFSNRRTFEMELVARVINLKCDSTFTFETRSCLCSGSGAGTWYVLNGEIHLQTSRENLGNIEKEKEKSRKFKRPCKNRWLDLTGATITNMDSFIVWRFHNNNVDTLYRE